MFVWLLRSIALMIATRVITSWFDNRDRDGKQHQRKQPHESRRDDAPASRG